MKLKDKKIIFAGCSFTYGHGLWHYSKEKGLPKNDEIIHLYYEFPESLNFMENNKFPRLVSNYFGIKEISKPPTSGSDEVSLHFIRELFGLKYPKTWTEYELNYEEVSHVIFQTSYLDRCFLIKDGKEIHIGDLAQVWKNYGNINMHIAQNVSEFWQELKTTYYNKIRDMFLFLEDKGIKCYMLAITDDYFDLIENDEFIKNRFIGIEYNGDTFKNFSDLFEFDKKLMIINDTDNFEDPPKDFHPTLKCHKVVAESIIKKLETDLS